MNSKNQYTLWQILAIWLSAAIPMGLLGWVAYPPSARDSLRWTRVCSA